MHVADIAHLQLRVSPLPLGAHGSVDAVASLELKHGTEPFNGSKVVHTTQSALKRSLAHELQGRTYFGLTCLSTPERCHVDIQWSRPDVATWIARAWEPSRVKPGQGDTGGSVWDWFWIGDKPMCQQPKPLEFSRG